MFDASTFIHFICLLNQGLPGAVGPVGPSGPNGDKVSLKIRRICWICVYVVNLTELLLYFRVKQVHKDLQDAEALEELLSVILVFV